MELTDKQVEDLALVEACKYLCVGMLRYIKKKQNLTLPCLREGFIATIKYNKNYSPENYRKMLDKIGRDFGLESEESIDAEVYYFLAILAEKGIKEGKSSFDEYFKLIKKSAKYGNIDACKYVASKYIIGDWVEDIPKNIVKAKKYVDIGLSKGQNHLNINEEFKVLIDSINTISKMREHRANWPVSQQK